MWAFISSSFSHRCSFLSCRDSVEISSFSFAALAEADSMVYSTSSSPFPLRLLSSFASLLLHHCTSAVVLSYVFVLAAADASVSPAAVAVAFHSIVSSVRFSFLLHIPSASSSLTLPWESAAAVPSLATASASMALSSSDVSLTLDGFAAAASLTPLRALIAVLPASSFASVSSFCLLLLFPRKAFSQARSTYLQTCASLRVQLFVVLVQNVSGLRSILF